MTQLQGWGKVEASWDKLGWNSVRFWPSHWTNHYLAIHEPISRQIYRSFWSCCSSSVIKMFNYLTDCMQNICLVTVTVNLDFWTRLRPFVPALLINHVLDEGLFKPFIEKWKLQVGKLSQGPLDAARRHLHLICHKSWAEPRRGKERMTCRLLNILGFLSTRLKMITRIAIAMSSSCRADTDSVLAGGI